MKKLIVSLLTLISVQSLQAQTAANGILQINGEPGPSQFFPKVKAVRCEENARAKCDEAVYLELNRPFTVKAGSYILGYENSIYPGWVRVAPGETISLDLVKLAIPEQFAGQSEVRVYRDFSSLLEQKKVYFEMYAMGRHFFRLGVYNFGDYYLTSTGQRDMVQKYDYKFCNYVMKVDSSANAQSVCNAWNGAKNMMGLTLVFQFHNDYTFTEMWVTTPGDVVPSKHARYLVAAPTQAENFVSVFPGVYRVTVNGPKFPSIRVNAGEAIENFNLPVLPIERNNLNAYTYSNTLPTTTTTDTVDCMSVRTWRTQDRAYCTSDSQEGCDRNSATLCEAM